MQSRCIVSKTDFIIEISNIYVFTESLWDIFIEYFLYIYERLELSFREV